MHTGADAASPCELVERVLGHARRSPHSAAVIDVDGSVVTMGTLSTRVERLMERLQIEPGEVVGVCLPRGVDVIVAMIAILRAGGIYSPLSPDDPPARTAQLEARIGSRWRVEMSNDDIGIRQVGPTARCLDLGSRPGDRPVYVMWTSGSTGVPKPVVVPERGVLRLVDDRSIVDVRPDDRFAFASNPMFDATTWEVWAALGNGCAVVVIDAEDLLDHVRLKERFVEGRVTVAFLTSSLFNHVASVAPTTFRTVRVLGVGGEPLRCESVRRVLDSGAAPVTLFNGYGPTECTTFAVCGPVGPIPEDAHRVPIGLPIHATEIAIVGDDGSVMPDGDEGELWIGGDGVALGYLDDADLTADRFVEVTLPGRATDRWYRTGDIAVVLDDGRVDCLGRRDRQVKIRGYRVEPHEIERALLDMTGVATAAVVARRGDIGVSLVAFCVPSDGDIDPTALRQSLRSMLPGYMVPSRIVIVSDLPLTPNGKLDDRSLLARLDVDGETPLLEPDGPSRTRTDISVLRDADDPVHDVVLERARIVLGAMDLGIDDDLWDAGLDSLGAVELAATVDQLGLGAVREADLIDHRTVRSLVRAMVSDRREQPDSVVLAAAGTRAPMILVPGAGANLTSLQELASALVPDRPSIAVVFPDLRGSEPPDRTVRAMATRVIRVVESRVPRGPLVLGGYSSGGVVAYEAAYQLATAGRQVRVVLLDSNFLHDEFDPRSPNRLGIVRRRVRRTRQRVDALSQRRRLARHRAAGSLASLDLVHELSMIAIRAVSRYRPPRCDVPVFAVHVPDSVGLPSVRAVIPHAVCVEVEANHHHLLRRQPVASFAPALGAWLDSGDLDVGSAR